MSKVKLTIKTVEREDVITLLGAEEEVYAFITEEGEVYPMSSYTIADIRREFMEDDECIFFRIVAE